MPGTQTNAELSWDALVDPGGGPGPLHARLAATLRAAIRDGRLPPGSALPPSRLLATDLSCSRWAVTEAYGQLVAEGYLHARVGSGTRVAPRARADATTRAPVAAPPGRPAIDLAPGLPDLRHFPVQRWLAASSTALAALPYERMGYPAGGGEPELRAVLAGYLNRVRGAAADPAHLTVCTGVTDAVRRLCLVVCGGTDGSGQRAAGGSGSRGARAAVAVEDPGWTGLREALVAAGLTVVPVPVDANGIRVDLLDQTAGVRAVVVSPAHQFPTGAVLAPQRRAALLDWARRVDGVIVEDDYDAEFRYDRRPVGTVQGTDPDRVALAGSLSKTLSPALGLGWLVAPARWTGALRRAYRPPVPPVPEQLAFAEFLRSGRYDRHLRASRQRYRNRRNALVSALATALPGATVSGAAAGLHLLVHPHRAAREPPDGPAVVARAAAAGVHIACVEQYRVRPGPLDGALVLGYGNLGDAEVPVAVSRLATALRAPG